jgi:hypothetical protein
MGGHYAAELVQRHRVGVLQEGLAYARERTKVHAHHKLKQCLLALITQFAEGVSWGLLHR